MNVEEYKRLVESISNELLKLRKNIEVNAKPISENLRATLEPFSTKLNEFSAQIKATISDKKPNNDDNNPV